MADLDPSIPMGIITPNYVGSFGQGLQVGQQFQQARAMPELLKAEQQRRILENQALQQEILPPEMAQKLQELKLQQLQQQQAGQAQGMNIQQEDFRHTFVKNFASTIKPFLDSGDIEGVKKITAERIAAANQYGIPSTDLEEAKQMLDNGQVDVLKQMTDQFLSFSPENLRAQELQFRKEQAGISLEEARKDREIQRRKLSLSEREAERQAKELNPTEFKALTAAQDSAQASQLVAGRMDGLADEFERNAEKISSGVLGSTGELFKKFTGNQDAITELRKNYLEIKGSQVVKNLPPGSASDADIKLAIAGFPEDTDAPGIIASKLRGMAKLQRMDAEYNNLKAQLIESQKDTRGLNTLWAEKVKDMFPDQSSQGQTIGRYTVRVK